MAVETREARSARFAAAMTAAGAKVESSEDEGAGSAAPEQPEAGGLAPVATPQDTGTAAAAAGTEAATPAPSRWKRKVKALDEEREIDLATMPETELDALLGRGLAYDTVKERYRAARDNALEQLETVKGTAATERDKAWAAALARDGLTLVKDPSSPTGLKAVAAAKQTASADGGAGGQAIDLDALEKKAVEENTAEAWAAYTRGLRASIPKSTGEADVKRMVESTLEASRQQSAQAESQQRKSREFTAKFETVKTARKADFALAGDLADHFERAAQNAALLESMRQPTKDQLLPSGEHDPKKFTPPTEESVLRLYHAHADSAKRAFTGRGPVVDLSKPRAKAPTVIPSSGASASGPTDPRKIDRSTPEGKKQAAEYLEKLAAAKRQPVSV